MWRKSLFTCIVLFVFMSSCQINPIYPLTYQIKTQVVSVAVTATKLPTTPLVGREYILITNLDTTKTIYVGSSTVTISGATTGTPILPSESYYAEYDNTVDIYGIVGVTTANVVVEEGK